MKRHISHLRKRLLVYLAHEIALPYFKLVRKGYHFPYALPQLQQLPDGTVGRELYRFFNDHDLQLLPHYEKHDIKHVVLGYPPTEEGEVCLQCFMLGNGRITAPVLFSVVVGLLILPDKWSSFRQAWIRGRRTPSLNRLNWFALVPQPLQQVRQQLLLSSRLSA